MDGNIARIGRQLQHALTIAIEILAAGAIITALGTALIARAHPPRGRFINVDGLRQHVVELAGENKDAPPIVLVHGAGCNLEDMRLALGERLAARRLILIDRPGHGWSQRRGRGASSPAYQAAMVRGVLDQLGIDRAIIVGHSWGGALAVRLALDDPQRVCGLALLAPPLYPLPRRAVWFYAIMATPGLGWLIAHTMLLPLGALFIGIGFRGAFLPQRPPRHYLRRAGTLLSLRPKTFLAGACDIAHLQENLPLQAGRYAMLAMPMTVMTGDRDLIIAPGQQAFAFAEAVPAARLVVLPGIGHMLHHAAADRVIAEIEALATNYSPAAPSPT
jgi:pimeloyl-ACP methyl ester carboxylesterase